MANDAIKTSQLGIVTTLSSNDRVVVLTNPASSAQTQTISLANFANSLVANAFPIANSTQLGVIKVGAGLSIAANGVLTAPMPVANTSSYGVIKVGNNLSINATGYLSACSGIPQTGGSAGYVLTSDANGNGSWQPFGAIYNVNIINDRNSYTITANDSVLFVDPNAVDHDITIILPIDAAIEGKEILIKNINPGASHKVTVITDAGVQYGSNYLENPVTGNFVVSYDIKEKGEGETWIHDGTVYRHIATERAIPIFYTDANTYAQVVVKNNSAGNNASGDLVVYGNNGDEVGGTGPFIDMGIDSNTYSNSQYSLFEPSDAYIYTGNANLLIGTDDPAKQIQLFAGGTQKANKKLTINSSSVGVSINFIPTANNVYTLGNSSMRFQSIYVGGNSVVFADQNPEYPDQILTVGNGVFYVTNSGNTTQQSNAGFAVGNFLLQNNVIALTNSSAVFYLGSTAGTGNLVINRPIVVYSTGTNTNPTFAVSRDGRLTIAVANSISAFDAGAVNITGTTDGAYQAITNPGGMLHITGNDGVTTRVTLDSFGSNSFPIISGRAARGTANTPSNIQANDTLFRISAIGWAGGNNFSLPSTSVGPTTIEAQALENFSNTGIGTQWNIYNANVGTLTKTLVASFNTHGLKMQSTNSGITFTDNSFQNTAFNSSSAVTKINVGTGLTQSGNVGIVGIDSTAVLSVAGTANQISVSNVGGNYTLSLPQNIGTSSNVQFSTITVTNLTVTGTSTIANSSSVANAVLNLAYNSSNSSQIDNGGITLGNTSSTYYVSIKYNLSNNVWTTGNSNFITKNLTVTSNVTGNNAYFNNALHAGGAYIGYDFPNATIQADCNINGYNQIVEQNHNSGTQASSDFVAVNDTGNDASNYIDMGINSSTYANNDYSMGGPNDGYLYVNGGDLDIATQTAGKAIKFFTGNTTSSALTATVNTSGISVVGNVVATNFTGTLIGTANNTNYVGSVTATNVVSNAQLSANLANYQTLAGLASNVATFGYQTTAGLAANVATFGYQTTAGLSANVAKLTANLATYIIANTGLISNSSGVFVDNAYIISVASGADNDNSYQTVASLPSSVLALTANNTTYVGSVTAANVVSNAQLSANLSNYQTTAGLSANVATLTSNNTSYIGSVSAANVVSNAQLVANLGNYVISSYLSTTLSGYQTSAGLSANVATLTSNNTSYVGSVSAANVVSNAQLVANLANYQTSTGLSSNVATLTANNTSYVGSVTAANVVSNAQLFSNLANYTTTSALSANLANYQTSTGLSSNVATLTANNTSYVGSVTAANVVSNAQLVANLANYVTATNLSNNLANYQTSAGLNANVSALGYINATAAHTFTAVQTFAANLTINTNAGIIANGSVGLAGQFLKSNGSSVYWSNTVPDYQVFSLEADRSLLTANTTQTLFGVGVTLASNTKYRYFIYATVYKANTSPSSTGALQFAITNSTSSATLARSYYVTNPCAANTSQTTLMNAQQMSQNITTGFNTLTTITNSNTGATWYNMVIDGTLDVTTGGTINPQIGFTHTANLGSSTVLQAGATMEIWPVGNATSNAVIGTWA